MPHVHHLLRSRRLSFVAAPLALLVAATAGAVDPPSITTALPGGQVGPIQRAPQPPGLPVTAPYPVADWWFSMIFKYSALGTVVPQGNQINPLPFNISPGFAGLALYCPYAKPATSTVACGGGSTSCPGFEAIVPQTFSPEAMPGLAATNNAGFQWPTDPPVTVRGWSRWSVTFDMTDANGQHTLRATTARGSPYVWVEYPDTTTSSDYPIPQVQFNDASDQIFGTAKQACQVWTGASNYTAFVSTSNGTTASDPMPNVAVVSVNGRTYALLGPSGSHWEWISFVPAPYWSMTFYCQNAGNQPYTVVCAMPANLDALIAASSTTRQAAVNLLLGAAPYRPANESSTSATSVAFTYSPSGGGSNVTGTFSFETLVDIRTGATAPAEQPALFALFPHQQAALTTTSALLSPDMTYTSAKGFALATAEPRGGFGATPAPDAGQMRLASGRSFTLGYSLPSIPPVVTPASAFSGSIAQLQTYLQSDLVKYSLPLGIDTYNWGKQLTRVANNYLIAKAVNDPTESNWLDLMRTPLSQWFTAVVGGKPKPIPTTPQEGGGVFYFDDTWGTLIGYPASFGSNDYLNDHHFHYGYFLRAAAVLGAADPAWLAIYKDYVTLLARDIAADPGDSATVGGVATSFAPLNYFDPYSGHGNAAGVQQYANGINQESSSEAVNAWYGMLLWADLIQDSDMLARAAFMYCSETDAARRYWFQEDSQVAGTNPVTNATLANIFDNVYQYGGFQTGPQYLHIINWLPFGGGAQYLAKNVPYAAKNYQALLTAFGSTNWTSYADLIWMYRRISDQGDAQSQFNATITGDGSSFTCDSGNTLSMTYWWIWSSVPGSNVPGDLDGDGAVGNADLGALLGDWGTCGAPCPSDLNGDGAVDGVDLGLLLSLWTKR
jgi:hypothetical protein